MKIRFEKELKNCFDGCPFLKYRSCLLTGAENNQWNCRVNGQLLMERIPVEKEEWYIESIRLIEESTDPIKTAQLINENHTRDNQEYEEDIAKAMEKLICPCKV